jgi:predicted metal-dependent hydrolase
MRIKETIFFIIILSIIFAFVNINKTEALIIESNIDNQLYIVRNLPDKQQAANMLATIKKKLIKLVEYLDKNNDKEVKENKEYIKRILNKIYTVKIRESSGNSKYTSYSVNKGDELVFCIRSKIDNSLHDINLIMYVAVHEIAHIGCPEVGHGELFNSINKFLLNYAMKIGIYRYENFNVNPVEYCGMSLNNHI